VSVHARSSINVPTHFNPLEPRIFATTYNCGGCTPDNLDLEITLPLWLPLDFDLYIIAVRRSIPWVLYFTPDVFFGGECTTVVSSILWRLSFPGWQLLWLMVW